MVAVQLDTVILAPVSNLADAMWLDVPARRDSDGIRGEIRRYAGGRVRSISRPGQVRTVPITADWVALTDVDRLRSWLGQLLLYRDPRGRKLWCVFFSLDVDDELFAEDLARIALTLSVVSHVEAV